jgi:hypothetical protein
VIVGEKGGGGGRRREREERGKLDKTCDDYCQNNNMGAPSFVDF